MSTEEKFYNHVKMLSEEFAEITASEDKDIAILASFISRVYGMIWTNCSEDSPYLVNAKIVIESDDAYWGKAQAIFGILVGLSNEYEQTGYHSPIDEKAFYKSYEKFSSAVRNWLIAYGVAGPAILIAEESILKRIVESNCVLPIGILFLGGVLLQVIKSIVYKTSSWYAMDYKYTPESKETWKMKSSEWINNNMWTDMLIDLLTIGMFISATIVVLKVI